jgi:hypothetical protein
MAVAGFRFAPAGAMSGGRADTLPSATKKQPDGLTPRCRN